MLAAPLQTATIPANVRGQEKSLKNSTPANRMAKRRNKPRRFFLASKGWGCHFMS
jgi:hypothetical protein